MKYTIDRITDGIAVLEDENGDLLSISAALLPENIREGSVLKEEDGEFIPDENEESERRKKLFALQNKLKNKTGSGN